MMLYGHFSSMSLHFPASPPCTRTQEGDSLVLHLSLPSRPVLLPCLRSRRRCCGCREVLPSHGRTLPFPTDPASRLCKNCFHQNFRFSMVELVPNHSTCRQQRFLWFPATCSWLLRNVPLDLCGFLNSNSSRATRLLLHSTQKLPQFCVATHD